MSDNVQPAKTYKADSLPFDTRLSLALEEGTINGDGYRYIASYLQEQGLDAEPLAQIRQGGIMLWTTREGKLPKRVQKAYWKAGIKLTPKQVTEIGNLAKRYSVTTDEYIFDFTRNVDWDDGDFNDENSCFWGDRSRALDVIREAGGFAMRLYWKPDIGELQGLGRCWVIPQCERLFLFNAYGRQVNEFALIMGTLLQQPIYRIDLNNNGDDSGLLYINSAMGYAIGGDQIGDHDFELEASFYTCSNCNVDVSEDELMWGNGDSYCQDCFDERFFTCEHCGEYANDEDRHVLTDSGENYCDLCFSRADQCEHCENRFSTTADFVHTDEGWVCSNCASEATTCDECDNVYLHDFSGEVCDDCTEKQDLTVPAAHVILQHT